MWLSASAPNKQAHCSLTSLLAALLPLLLLPDHGTSPMDCLHSMYVVIMVRGKGEGETRAVAGEGGGGSAEMSYKRS